MCWVAFSFLGLLVGNIVGLTSASISNTVLAAIFAFIGGSVVTFQSKLTNEQIRFALHAITAFSIFTLFGIYIGILVKEYQLLSPASNIADKNPYLRSSTSDYVKIDELEDEVIAGRKTKQQAFDEMLDLLKDTK